MTVQSVLRRRTHTSRKVGLSASLLEVVDIHVFAVRLVVEVLGNSAYWRIAFAGQVLAYCCDG